MSSAPGHRTGSDANPLSTWVRNWNWFWFNPADPTLLGLIRLWAGFLTFYVCLAYSVDLQEFFGARAWIDLEAVHDYRIDWPYPAPPQDWGDSDQPAPIPPANEYERNYIQKYDIHPRQALAKGYYSWSIWYHVSDPTAIAIVHGVILIIVFLFTIGFCTRITSVLTWLGVVSYSQRAPTTLFGMDTMMNLLLIYLMIGPSGASFSVDRLISRYWATWRALRARKPAPSSFPAVPRVSANFALRCMQFNLCLVYFTSGVSKLQGGAWWRGEAVWGTVANPEFSPIHYEWFLAFLTYLCRHRWLWEAAMNCGAAFTLATEIGFPFLIWLRPWRWVMLTMAVMLHTGIAVFMGLNTFSLMMLGLLLSFVPQETIQWLIGLVGRGARHLRLSFNNRSRSQVRSASLIRAVDAWDQVTVQDTTATGDRLHLITPQGEKKTGFALWEELVRSLRPLRLLTPLLYIPGLRRLGMSWFPPEDHDRANASPALEAHQKAKNQKVPS